MQTANGLGSHNQEDNNKGENIDQKGQKRNMIVVLFILIIMKINIFLKKIGIIAVIHFDQKNHCYDTHVRPTLQLVIE